MILEKVEINSVKKQIWDKNLRTYNPYLPHSRNPNPNPAHPWAQFYEKLKQCSKI